MMQGMHPFGELFRNDIYNTYLINAFLMWVIIKYKVPVSFASWGNKGNANEIKATGISSRGLFLLQSVISTMIDL